MHMDCVLASSLREHAVHVHEALSQLGFQISAPHAYTPPLEASRVRARTSFKNDRNSLSALGAEISLLISGTGPPGTTTEDGGASGPNIHRLLLPSGNNKGEIVSSYES